MTDLHALIEKLEQATGPSRELDALIADAVMERVNMRMGEEEQPDGSWKPYYRTGYGLNGARWSHPPQFTDSVDVALMLVPEGYIVDHIGHDAVGQMGALKAIGGTAELTNGIHRPQGQSKTLALAVCVVSLKARASLSTEANNDR